MANIFSRNKQPKESITAEPAHRKQGIFSGLREAIKNVGRLDSGLQNSDRLPHPANMTKYGEWASKPQVNIGIDIKTKMVAGSGFYIQMPEEYNNKTVQSDHQNKQTVEDWLRRVNFRDTYKQIQRMKYTMGFAAVEVQSDKTLKVLPSETIYIHRKPTGEIIRYSQRYNNQEVASWQANDKNLVLFIRNQDPLHPYGVSVTESIGGLIEAKDQLNIDMPKIIHRYSSPLGIHECSRDITQIKQAIEDADVDEDIYIGNVEKDEVRHTFVEPTTQVKFLDYIDQIDFQIGQELHAPLILLMKNATEASATKMLDSVDRDVHGEQEQNADIIEQRLFTLLVSPPIPEFMHGATTEVLNEVTLDQIGALTGKTISKRQAQDLIRKKGLDLIEDEEWLNMKPQPFLSNVDPETGQPQLNPDKINQLEMRLHTLREGFVNGKILISEALREGDRAISGYVEKAKLEADRQCRNFTGKPLTAESTQHFELIRRNMFCEYRDHLVALCATPA
jgi:hypothetical protein